MDQKLQSANPSGQQAHRKWGSICPMELWDGMSLNGLITVPAFFQVPLSEDVTVCKGTELT